MQRGRKSKNKDTAKGYPYVLSFYEVSIQDERKRTLVMEEYYSASGLLVGVIQYFPSGMESERSSFTYDNDGNLLTEIITNNEGGETVTEWIGVEDVHSRRITRIGDWVLEEEKVEVDGEVTTITVTDGEGQEKQKYVYYHDGEVLVSKELHEWGDLAHKETYIHDSKGRVTKTLCHSPGQEDMDVFQKYDHRGNQVEESHIQEEEQIFLERATYDYVNHTIEKTLTAEGEKVTVIEKYNRKELLEEIVSNDEDGNCRTRELTTYNADDDIIEVRFYNLTSNPEYGNSYIEQYDFRRLEEDSRWG